MKDKRPKTQQIIDFVTEHPGYEASEIDEALEFKEKTSSGYLSNFIADKIMRREKNERGVFIYFMIRDKRKPENKQVANKECTNYCKKDIVNPKDEKEMIDCIMKTVKEVPGLTSYQISQLTDSETFKVSSILTKNRASGYIARTFNSTGQSIWFTVPFNGKMFPASEEVFKEEVTKRSLSKSHEEKKENTYKQSLNGYNVQEENNKQGEHRFMNKTLEDCNIDLSKQLEKIQENVEQNRKKLDEVNNKILLLSSMTEKQKKLNKLQEEEKNTSDMLAQAMEKLSKLEVDFSNCLL